tara:strand:+ start:429 stop:1916 length:1488 start_codon:yes stop_codon:yes gene_type:complete
MSSECQLLNDDQVRAFIVNGFHAIGPDVPADVHDTITARLDELIVPGENPGDNILPLVPQMQQVLDSPAIHGAATSLFGKDYIVLPHRHCHEMGFNADDTDRTYLHYFSHQDGHSPMTRACHHVPRYGLLMYYPQEVPLDFGPTHVLPGTQYHKGLIKEEKLRGRPTGGPQGSACLTHFDVGHGAGVNRTQRMRFMVKFVIARAEDPVAASWANENSDWVQPDEMEASHEHPLMWNHVWNWMRGAQNGLPGDDGLLSTTQLIERLDAGSNEERNAAIYQLAAQGAPVVPDLIAHIAARPFPEERPSMMERAEGWGNPNVMEDAAFALAAIGKPAVPLLVDALTSNNEWMSINAAFALGEMGSLAAEAVPALCQCLEHASFRVVRTAVDALGMNHAGRDQAVPALADFLLARKNDTEPDWREARINAATALLKLSPVPAAEEALIEVLGDSDYHVRYFAMLALRRLGSATACAAACDYLHAHCWADDPTGVQTSEE